MQESDSGYSPFERVSIFHFCVAQPHRTHRAYILTANNHDIVITVVNNLFY